MPFGAIDFGIAALRKGAGGERNNADSEHGGGELEMAASHQAIPRVLLMSLEMCGTAGSGAVHARAPAFYRKPLQAGNFGRRIADIRDHAQIDRGLLLANLDADIAAIAAVEEMDMRVVGQPGAE